MNANECETPGRRPSGLPRRRACKLLVLHCGAAILGGEPASERASLVLRRCPQKKPAWKRARRQGWRPHAVQLLSSAGVRSGAKHMLGIGSDLIKESIDRSLPNYVITLVLPPTRLIAMYRDSLSGTVKSVGMALVLPALEPKGWTLSCVCTWSTRAMSRSA